MPIIGKSQQLNEVARMEVNNIADKYDKSVIE
jgi:hypothetical protein